MIVLNENQGLCMFFLIKTGLLVFLLNPPKAGFHVIVTIAAIVVIRYDRYKKTGVERYVAILIAACFPYDG